MLWIVLVSFCKMMERLWIANTFTYKHWRIEGRSWGQTILTHEQLHRNLLDSRQDGGGRGLAQQSVAEEQADPGGGLSQYSVLYEQPHKNSSGSRQDGGGGGATGGGGEAGAVGLTCNYHLLEPGLDVVEAILNF